MNQHIFGFQIMHEVIESEERSVYVDEMLRTSVSVHVFQFCVLGILAPQIGNLSKEFSI